MYNQGSIQWQVQHYGAIVDDYQTSYDGYFFRQKIYKYDGGLYLETWCNGETPLFKKL